MDNTNKKHVISADSVQVYQDVSIGANQPTKEERIKTPHALIDFLPPTIPNYNAADWTRDATFLIQHLTQQQQKQQEWNEGEDSSNDDIIQEKRSQHLKNITSSATSSAEGPVLVVGGTMMYLQWLVHGRPDAQKPTSEAIQKAASIIEPFQDASDWEGAIEFIEKQKQPDIIMKRIQQLCGQDWYRLRRILEIAFTSTSSPDALFTGERTNGLLQQCPDNNFDIDLRCFFLCPNDRLQHMHEMDERCHSMILRGLLNETTQLLQKKIPLEGQVARAIGYRQTIDFLMSSEQTLDEYIANFCTATRRYAKKQMAWFRKDSSFVFVPVPMQLPPEDRIIQTTQHIQQLLCPTNYESELTSPNSSSVQTRQLNQQQGPKMKFFIPKPHGVLHKGSDEYNRILEQVQTCRTQLSSSQEQQIPIVDTKPIV